MRALAGLVVAFWGLSAANTADAGSGRYKRDTRRVAAPAPNPALSLPRRAKKKKHVPPPMTADQFMQIELRVQDIRDELIDEHRGLIADTDADDPALPDYLFRLGELTAQKHRFERMTAMDLHADIRVAKSRGAKVSLRARQKRRFSAARRALLETLRIYKRIADEPAFRDYPRMDQVLFYYGHTLHEAGYKPQALQVYKRLLKNHPQSRFVPDAYLAFAEQFFADGDLPMAERFYDKVIEFPASSIYPYALFKKGWVLMNVRRQDEALALFYQVLQVTRGKAVYESLRRTARTAFVRAYADVGKPRLALEAFARVDRSRAPRMLEQLGDLYLDRGNVAKSVYVFRKLIALAPDDERVCQWQFNVTRAVLTTGTPAERAAEVHRLVDLYARADKARAWTAAVRAQCREDARATASNIARLWHREAQVTHNPETLGQVDALYRAYADAFGDEAADANEMHFNYGELLWWRAETEPVARRATALWERAAVQYTRVAQRPSVDKAIAKESAYAAVLAWKNAIDIDPRTALPPPPSEAAAQQPEPIGRRHAAMLAAFERYRGFLTPDHRDYAGTLFLDARVRWRHRHYDQAIVRFVQVLTAHRDHETAPDALVLLLDSYAALHKYDDMARWIERAAADKAFMAAHPQLAERLVDSFVWSARRRAEQLERDGAFLACGTLYSAIAERAPDHPRTDEVLYNGGVCYERAKSIGMAIHLRATLVKRFPASPHAQRALVQLGYNYSAIAYYAEAADHLERYAERYGGEDDAPTALSDAVSFRKGLGQSERALSNTALFVRRYRRKQPAQAADAMFSMTAVYERRGDRAGAIEHLRNYLRAMGKHGGLDRRVIAHAKLGQHLWEASCPGQTVDGACVRAKRHRKERKGARVRCGDGTTFVPQRRDPRLVREAQREMSRALALWDGGKAAAKVAAPRAAAMAHWAAAAQFLVSEAKYETFLAEAFPGVESAAALARYKTRKDALLLDAKQSYLAVLAVRGGGAQWAIAAASRVGLLYRSYADELLTAPLPASVRRGAYAADATDAYCDDLAALTDVLEEQSNESFGVCLDEAAKRSWQSPWSRLCERQLARHGRIDFTIEHHGAATRIGTVLARPAAAPAITTE